MNIFPAIDLYNGKVVRLFKGEYGQMTVYSQTPLDVAKDFECKGANFLHTVDLEGAKSGKTPNMETIKSLVKNTGLFVQVGGGIRSIDVIDRYLSEGVGRVILGTAAVTDKDLVIQSVKKYGQKIAVGADIKDGMVAIKGWTEKSNFTCNEFFEKIENFGVRTVICTDISRDGAMKGTNCAMYEWLSRKFSVDIIASGGVTDINDIISLRKLNLYGAIIGKGYYTGAIELARAIEVAR